MISSRRNSSARWLRSRIGRIAPVLTLMLLTASVVSVAEAAPPSSRLYHVTATPTPVLINSTNTFTFTFVNETNSGQDLGSVQVNVASSGFTVAGPTDAGGCAPTAVATGNRTWAASIESGNIAARSNSAGNKLKPGDSLVVQFCATAPGTAGSRTVTTVAKPSTDLTGTSTFTNTGSDPTIDVVLCFQPCPADLALAKSGSPGTIFANAVASQNTVTYTITVTNNGPGSSDGVMITDTLPTELTGAIACTFTGSGNCIPSATFGSPVSIGTLSYLGTATLKIVAHATDSLRNGPITISNSASVSATTDDPYSNNNIASPESTQILTVPDAPVLNVAEPGDGKVGLMWARGDDGQGAADGGSPITGYDITAVPGPITAFFSGNTPNAGTQFSYLLTGLTNGTPYTITVQARNAVGDSDPSSSKQATPCATCVVATASGTQATTLNTGGGTDCPGNPPKAPGATSTDTIVSCYVFPSGQTTKSGSILAANEQASVTGVDCGLTDTCIGGQVFYANPAGECTDFNANSTCPTIIWNAFYDRTITTDIFGKPCLNPPCPSNQYVYEAFFKLPNDEVGIQIGSSDQSTWCPTGVVPDGQPACVVLLRQLNQSTAPNGSKGVNDVQVQIAFRGDPRGGLSG